jgi:hypothetical protein
MVAVLVDLGPSQLTGVAATIAAQDYNAASARLDP